MNRRWELARQVGMYVAEKNGAKKVGKSRAISYCTGAS